MPGPREIAWRPLLRAVAAVLLTGFTFAWLDLGSTWSGVPWSPLAAVPCDGAADPEWSRSNGDPVDPSGTTLLASNAFVVACPPTPGTLTLTLRGTLAAGIGTRAVLVQGPHRLLDVELRDETRTFEVDVPAAGQLLLAFVNDYYQPPEDRNLWVSGLAFTPRSP